MKSKEPKTIEKKEKREIKESNSKEKQTPL